MFPNLPIPDTDIGPVSAGGPLVVDMDGTLLRTDTLLECVALLLRKQPWRTLLLPIWLGGGRANLKRRLAEQVALDVDTLPVNSALHLWLVRQKARGRALHLLSAADQSIVTNVAARFGIFDTARGSDGRVNLSGRRKVVAILEEIGGGSRAGVTYAGDSRADLPVWRDCGAAVLVGDVERLQSALGAKVIVAERFAIPRPTAAVWARALRLHHWAKNLLLFVALLLGGNVLSDLPITVAGFVVFGLLASATYLLNDLLDLSYDRVHPSKRDRPIASGALPLAEAICAMVLLGAVCAVLLAVMPRPFVAVAAIYFAVTLAYSLRLKRVLMLDVFILAGLYTIRIDAGVAVVNHPFTPWLMAFSMFFFLSLACVKRYSEGLMLAAKGRAALPGRAYQSTDGPWLMAMGSAAAFSAMSTFFLFLVESGSPILSYPSPRWMWLICVILGYWICRIWALAARGQMHDDPVLFALKDPASLVMAGATAALSLLARS